MIKVETAPAEALRAWLPPLAEEANKYTRGELVIVAGSEQYPGAACLCAAASQRTGAGYTAVWCSEGARAALHGFRPSIVARSWNGFSAASVKAPTAKHPTAILVGPGLDGEDPKDRARALDVLRYAATPLVVDGGAITALASDEGRQLALARGSRGLPLIVTPHGGEAARLARPMNYAPAEARNPAVLALALATDYRAVVALKGPETFISDGARVYRMDEGTAALAKAGTGDVLSGMIAALLVQGAGPLEAAVLGTTLHARAGVRAAQETNARSVIPEDVIAAIPHALSTL